MKRYVLLAALAIPFGGKTQDLNEASRYPSENGTRTVLLSNGAQVVEDRSGLPSGWDNVFGDVYLMSDELGVFKTKLPISGYDLTTNYIFLKPFDFEGDGVDEIILQLAFVHEDGAVDRGGCLIYGIGASGNYEELPLLDVSSKIESSAHLVGVRGDGHFFTQEKSLYWEFPSDMKGKTTSGCEIRYDSKKDKLVLLRYDKK